MGANPSQTEYLGLGKKYPGFLYLFTSVMLQLTYVRAFSVGTVRYGDLVQGTFITIVGVEKGGSRC